MYVQRVGVLCTCHILYVHRYPLEVLGCRSTFIPTLLVKMLRTGLSAGGGRKRKRMLTYCTNTAYQC